MDTGIDPLAPPNMSVERTQSQLFFREAQRLSISTSEQYEAAANLGKGIAALIKEIDRKCGGFVEAAYQAHKAAVAFRDGERKPLIEAKAMLGRKCGQWSAEQEQRRIIREKEARLAVQRQEEEARLADAVKLEQQGKQDEAVALIGQPIETPPVVLASTTPKVEGASKRKNWKFRIVDAEKVPTEYRKIDEVLIGQIVRATHGQVVIPGVEVYAEEHMAFGSSSKAG